MTVPARRLHFDAGDTGLSDIELEVYAGDVLAAGERICPPSERSGSTSGAALLLLALLIGAGGAGALYAKGDLLAWMGDRMATLGAASDAGVAPDALTEPSGIAVAAEAPVEVPTAMIVTADAPVPPTADAPTAPVETASISTDADATAPAETLPAEPLPPPQVNPADPYQRRASAAGLHPGISRVLLARMSTSDYRNARYAVDTALDKTGDEAVFVWPRQRRPEQALFRVHFVPGAPQNCRRYVVTVVKDGWTTTALPLERCGIARKKDRSAAASTRTQRAAATGR